MALPRRPARREEDVPADYNPPISVTREEVLIDGSEDRFRDLIYALFVAGGRFQEIREAFGREIEVTGPQYFVLMAVARFHAQGGIGIGGLAEHLHVAAPHVTTEVGKLVERGLLAKRPNPEDGRRVLVTLSKAGMAVLERLAPFRQRINNVLFDGFSREEFLTLARLLDRFLSTTERALDVVADHERQRRRADQSAQAAE